MRIKKFLLFSFLDFLGYLFLYMPHFLRLKLAKGIAFCLYKLDNRRKFDLLANLDFAYDGALSEAQKHDILMRNYLNLVYNSISFFMLSVSKKEHILNLIEVRNKEIVTELLEKGEKLICLSAHFGNWEYIGSAFTCTFNHPITAIARLTKSEVANEYLTKVRSTFNISMLDKKGAMSGLVRALKKNEAVGIISDQNTASNEGLLVRFFNKNVRHTPSASLLALKYNAKILHFTATYSEDYKKLFVYIYPPLEYKKTNNLNTDLQNLTQLQSDMLEKIIRENPKEWFWFHKKFKNQYEHIYK